MTLVAHKTSQSPKTQVAKTLIDTFKEPDRSIRKGYLNVSTINGLVFQLFLVIRVDLWGILNAMPKSPGFKVCCSKTIWSEGGKSRCGRHELL